MAAAGASGLGGGKGEECEGESEGRGGCGEDREVAGGLGEGLEQHRQQGQLDAVRRPTKSRIPRASHCQLVEPRLTLESQLNEAGLEIGEEDAVSDPELLMSILETREALEAAQTEDEVAVIRQANLGAFLPLVHRADKT